MELNSLKIKVDKYIAILENTSNYRKDWSENLKGMITSTLEQIIKETGIKATIDVQDDIENLEVLILNLGQEVSGISEKIPNSTYKKPFIKNQGALIYQQLFNGKVMIMIAYPVIEGYGQPKPPKMVEILRPEEFKQTYIIRHVEQFMKEIIDWEDYDDDIHEHMASSPIGFQAQNLISEEPTS